MERTATLNLSRLVAETATLGRTEFLTRFPSPALVFGEPLSTRRSIGSSGTGDLDQIYDLTDAYALDPQAAPRPPRLGLDSRVEFLPGSPGVGETQERLVTVGRAADSDVRIEASTISLMHAGFMRSAKGWSIVDAQSTNGTTLNGRALSGNEPVVLRDGDAIGFGPETHAIFLSPGALFDRITTLRSS